MNKIAPRSRLVDPAQEAMERAAVCREARGWLGTPYHHYAAIKGAGVDCAMLPLAVYSAVGLLGAITVERYSPQWYLHRGEERYLEIVQQWAVETDMAQLGDLVLYRIGRLWAHGAIVVDPSWPTIVHASARDGMVRLDEGNGSYFADEVRHPHRFFTMWVH